MIAKQIIGSGFRGALEYLRHGSRGAQRERGEVLDTNLPANDHSPRAFARSMGAFRKLNPKLGRAVYHVSLSPAPGDEISDEQWREIARRYLTGMGFEDCGFVLVKHDDEAGSEGARPPHVHILACRIRPDGSTVSDQNNYRRSEKLVREIEARFGLVQVAGKPRKTKPEEESPMNEKLNAYAAKRLEAAAQDADDVMAIAQATEVYAAEPAGALTDRERRDYKREILEAEYQAIVRDTFVEQVRYVRRGTSGLTLHFRSGGRILDAGDRVSAHGMPATEAAEAIIELAILKGWPSVVLTGNEAFLNQAFAIALAKGLTVQPRPDQIEIFLRVQQAHAGKGGNSATSAATPPADPPRKLVRQMTGLNGFNERKQAQSEPLPGDIDSAPRRFRM